MLTILSIPEAGRLRELLRAAEYTENGFFGKLFLRELPSRQAGNLPWQMEATSDPTAFNLVTRLFLFGIPQTPEDAKARLSEDFLTLLTKTGMAVIDGDLIRPTVMLAPMGDFIVVADPLFRMQPVEEPDIILWPNDTTRLLLNSCVKADCGPALDLGAGCGIISLFLSKFSIHVVATDLNSRSEEFVQFNRWLNSAPEIEALTGDTFEPVASRRFDRILANPPFFITPSSDVLYCQNPLELDGFCRRVAREGAALLNEGGFLQMVFEWVELDGEPWKERLASWVEDTGCDAWIYRSYVTSPDSYAHQRTNRQYATSPKNATAAFERAMEYYRRHKVVRVLGGLMALRRRAGSNWLQIEEGRVNPGQPFGNLIQEIFETQDALRQASDDHQLLMLKPRLSQESQLEQQFTLENRAWAVESIKLTLHHALPAEIVVESSVADFLARCDGTHPLGQLVLQLAESVKADPAQVAQQCCGVVRKLAERRFITFGAS
jgi:methylase of polypeptide subunit release factors